MNNYFIVGEAEDRNGKFPIYQCRFCGIYRTRLIEQIAEHEKKCHHQEEFIAGVL